METLKSMGKKNPTAKQNTKNTSASVPCSWLSIQSFSSQALPSFPTCGGHQHSPNSWVKFHPRSLCFHRLQALGRISRYMLVSSTHTACWGFLPSFFLCGGTTMLGHHDTGFTTFPYFVTIWAPNWVKRLNKWKGWTWVKRQQDTACVFPPTLWWQRHKVNHTMCHWAGNPNVDGNSGRERVELQKMTVRSFAPISKTCLD